MRYTEYHAGKAVIKHKALLPGAMEKLARLEDLEENGRLGMPQICMGSSKIGRFMNTIPMKKNRVRSREIGY